MTVREILRLALKGSITFDPPSPDTESYGPPPPPPAAELVDSLRQRAVAGEAEAQRELGLLFYRGRAVLEDRAEAFKWLTLAARQGDLKAAQSLEFIGPTLSTEEAYEGRRRISELTGEPPPPPPVAPAAAVESRESDAQRLYDQALEAMRAQGLIGGEEAVPAPADAESQPGFFEPPPRPPGPPPAPRPVAWTLIGVSLLVFVAAMAYILYVIGRDQRDVARVPGQGTYLLQGGSQRASATPDVAELRAAAERGEARAQFQLGMLHAQGLGVPKDYEAAAQWYLKAALQRDIAAMNNLGVLYIQGTGVKQDFVQAYKWLHLAAQGGSTGSGRNRDQLALYMTADQIAEAMRQATVLRQGWSQTSP
jgi:TPR repeat protein